jgi:hypothetical protein
MDFYDTRQQLAMHALHIVQSGHTVPDEVYIYDIYICIYV